MAGADYLRCDKCGGKAIYDAHVDYEYSHASQIAVLCKECGASYEIVVRSKKTKGEIERYNINYLD